MIKDLYPQAHIISPFEPKGISNIIQSVADEDILYIKAKSRDQLNDLIEKYLSKSFKGLIVSPFKPSNDSYNYLVFQEAQIDTDLSEKMEYFYPLSKPIPPIFGVTGTNGKTSCCWLFSEVLKQLDKKVLYLGTVGTYLAGEKKEDKIITTTPSYLELRKIFYKYREEVDYIAVEVSSHALEQNRLGDLKFEASAWTNFTQDHLDYHKTMAAYFEAKKKIVSYTKDSRVLVLESEKEIHEKLIGHVESADQYLKNESLPQKDHFLGNGFIKKNISLTLATVKKLGFEIKNLNYDDIRLPPGRFEIVEIKKRIFVIDYAHTPDALIKLIEQVETTFKTGQKYILFGCGGDRDRTKRQIMGRAAAQFGYPIILTSDNPRSEDPEQILEDISKGISSEHRKEVNRKKAIEMAFELSSEGDVIVIAGKGHEDYQEINGKKIHFSDSEVVRKLNDKA